MGIMIRRRFDEAERGRSKKISSGKSQKRARSWIERLRSCRIWPLVQRAPITSHLSSGFALGDLSVSCLSLRTEYYQPFQTSFPFLSFLLYPLIYISIYPYTNVSDKNFIFHANTCCFVRYEYVVRSMCSLVERSLAERMHCSGLVNLEGNAHFHNALLSLP